MDFPYLSKTEPHLADTSKMSMPNMRRPHPGIFESWLPWACNQLNFSTILNIQKSQRTGLRRTRSGNLSHSIHHKSKSSRHPAKAVDSSDEESDSTMTFGNQIQDREINLDILYLNRDLVQIKFNNNTFIPPRLFKVIALVAHFYTHLSTIIINSGIDCIGLNELGKLLVTSHITEVFLDDCYIKELNYYVLLAEGNSVTYLSLSRCRIDDEALKQICDTLAYNGTASKTLQILTLSSNDITDVGAGYIANILRTNKQLKSLNLADNNLTDVGSDAIISILGMFKLTFYEMKDYYEKRLAYLKERQALINHFLRELKCSETHTSQQIKKKIRPRHKLSAMQGRSDINRAQDHSGSSITTIFAKAKQMAVSYLGKQDNLFPMKDIVILGNKIFSRGNASLSNLNLSYNELTYTSLIKISEVLYYQLSLKTTMGGVVRIRIEGNPLPVCEELQEIDNIISTYIDSIIPSDKSFYRRSRKALY